MKNTIKKSWIIGIMFAVLSTMAYADFAYDNPNIPHINEQLLPCYEDGKCSLESLTVFDLYVINSISEINITVLNINISKLDNIDQLMADSDNISCTYDYGTNQFTCYISDISGYVPYIGAEQNLNLGNYNFTTNSWKFEGWEYFDPAVYYYKISSPAGNEIINIQDWSNYGSNNRFAISAVVNATDFCLTNKTRCLSNVTGGSSGLTTANGSIWNESNGYVFPANYNNGISLKPDEKISWQLIGGSGTNQAYIEGTSGASLSLYDNLGHFNFNGGLVDVNMTFGLGSSNTGRFGWREDEDRFEFYDNINLTKGKNLTAEGYVFAVQDVCLANRSRCLTNATGGGAGTPAGADTQVQFNDGGSFGGDAQFVFDKTTNKLSLYDTNTGFNTIFSIDATSKPSPTALGLTRFELINDYVWALQSVYNSNAGLGALSGSYAFATAGSYGSANSNMVFGSGSSGGSVYFYTDNEYTDPDVELDSSHDWHFLKDNQKVTFGASGATDSYDQFTGTNREIYSSGSVIIKNASGYGTIEYGSAIDHTPTFSRTDYYDDLVSTNDILTGDKVTRFEDEVITTKRTDFTRPNITEICQLDLDNKTICFNKTDYPYQVDVEGRNTGKSIDINRILIAELKEKNTALEQQITFIKECAELSLDFKAYQLCVGMI